jgi:hypothetical protein
MKMYLMTVSSLKMCAVKTIHWGGNIFLSVLTTFIRDLGEILYKISACYSSSVCDFHENPSREGRTFFISINKITLPSQL